LRFAAAAATSPSARSVIALYFLFAHDHFGKPLHTFPDHVLARGIPRDQRTTCAPKSNGW
jgi:hypothetical protein